MRASTSCSCVFNISAAFRLSVCDSAPRGTAQAVASGIMASVLSEFSERRNRTRRLNAITAFWHDRIVPEEELKKPKEEGKDVEQTGRQT